MNTQPGLFARGSLVSPCDGISNPLLKATASGAGKAGKIGASVQMQGNQDDPSQD